MKGGILGVVIGWSVLCGIAAASQSPYAGAALGIALLSGLFYAIGWLVVKINAELE